MSDAPATESSPAPAPAPAVPAPATESSSAPAPVVAAPGQISPALALQLRVRWLEALIHGLRSTPAPAQLGTSQQQQQQSLTRRAHDVQTQLEGVARSNDAIRHFLDKWDQHAQLLSPAFALSPSSSSDSAQLFDGSVGAFDALLADTEPDIRAADSALREIADLESAGVTGAGRLAEHEALQPRLRALVQAQEEDLETASQLERRVGELLRRYAIEVRGLNCTFIRECAELIIHVVD